MYDYSWAGLTVYWTEVVLGCDQEVIFLQCDKTGVAVLPDLHNKGCFAVRLLQLRVQSLVSIFDDRWRPVGKSGLDSALDWTGRWQSKRSSRDIVEIFMGISLLIKLKSNSAVITVRNDLRDRHIIVKRSFPRRGWIQKSPKNPNFTFFVSFEWPHHWFLYTDSKVNELNLIK